LGRRELAGHPRDGALIELHGKPSALRVDNGSELTSSAFTESCETQDIELLISCVLDGGAYAIGRTWSKSIAVETL
jgi:hypothetical protein